MAPAFEYMSRFCTSVYTKTLRLRNEVSVPPAPIAADSLVGASATLFATGKVANAASTALAEKNMRCTKRRAPKPTAQEQSANVWRLGPYQGELNLTGEVGAAVLGVFIKGELDFGGVENWSIVLPERAGVDPSSFFFVSVFFSSSRSGDANNFRLRGAWSCERFCNVRCVFGSKSATFSDSRLMDSCVVKLKKYGAPRMS